MSHIPVSKYLKGDDDDEKVVVELGEVDRRRSGIAAAGGSPWRRRPCISRLVLLAGLLSQISNSAITTKCFIGKRR